MNKRGMVTKTILIIEDNADNRTLLKDLLIKFWKPATAKQG